MKITHDRGVKKLDVLVFQMMNSFFFLLTKTSVLRFNRCKSSALEVFE